jgi:hypothetical protein
MLTAERCPFIVPLKNYASGLAASKKRSGVFRAPFPLRMQWIAFLDSRGAHRRRWGNIVYIAPDRSLHPLGLLPYRVRLDRLLLVRVRRSEDLVWAVIEALRCPQASAVMAVLDGSSSILLDRAFSRAALAETCPVVRPSLEL